MSTIKRTRVWLRRLTCLALITLSGCSSTSPADATTPTTTQTPVEHPSTTPRMRVVERAPLAKDIRVDPTGVLYSDRHLVHGYPARTPDGAVHAIIEIPAGTVAKYEVRATTGRMQLDRHVDYLGYPGNYGMIPSTRAADGDPLDILVLGAAIPRGRLIKTRIIGALCFIDDGDEDHKLLAVTDSAGLQDGFSRLHSTDDLTKRYPGVATILTTFFRHYKHEDGQKPCGLLSATRAMAILNAAKLSTTQ